MSQQNNLASLAERLSSALKLEQAPVAIRFTDSIAAGVSGPATRVPAGCRFWQDAVSSTFVTSASDHNLCAIGVHTHNLEPSASQQADLMEALRVFGELSYVRPQDVAAIPVLASRHKYVVYSPLSEAETTPDVVVVFVDANQTLILSEATQQVEGQTAPAMGRPACAAIPQVVNTGRAALSLGCCGARAYLDVLTEGIAIFGIPGAKLPAYVERIEALSQANAILSKFHQLRRRDVYAGKSPTIKESLGAMGA